jgi:hypothetical protein
MRKSDALALQNLSHKRPTMLNAPTARIHESMNTKNTPPSRVAQLPPRRGACRLRRHPAFDILLGRDLDVELQLLLLFGISGLTAEEALPVHPRCSRRGDSGPAARADDRIDASADDRARTLLCDNQFPHIGIERSDRTLN